MKWQETYVMSIFNWGTGRYSYRKIDIHIDTVTWAVVSHVFVVTGTSVGILNLDTPSINTRFGITGIQLFKRMSKLVMKISRSGNRLSLFNHKKYLLTLLRGAYWGIMKQRESPPAWSQEAYRPLRIKYSLFYLGGGLLQSLGEGGNPVPVASPSCGVPQYQLGVPLSFLGYPYPSWD